MLEPTNSLEHVNLLVDNTIATSPSEPSLTYKVHPNFVSQRIQSLAQKHATPIAFWRDEKKPSTTTIQQRNSNKKNLYHHLIPKETVPKQVISPLHSTIGSSSSTKQQIVLAFPLDINSHFEPPVSRNIDELMEENSTPQTVLKSYTEMRSAHDLVMNRFSQQSAEAGLTNTSSSTNSNRRPYLLYRNPFPQGISSTKQILFTIFCILDLILFAYLYFVHPSVEQVFQWNTFFSFDNKIVAEPQWSFVVFQRFLLEPFLFCCIIIIRLLGIFSVWKHSLRGMHFVLCFLLSDVILSIYLFRTWWYLLRICNLIILIGLLWNMRSKLVFHWFTTPTL